MSYNDKDLFNLCSLEICISIMELINHKYENFIITDGNESKICLGMRHSILSPAVSITTTSHLGKGTKIILKHLIKANFVLL